VNKIRSISTNGCPIWSAWWTGRQPGAWWWTAWWACGRRRPTRRGSASSLAVPAPVHAAR